jgi:hypothetical protein
MWSMVIFVKNVCLYLLIIVAVTWVSSKCETLQFVNY